jgi:hypothetical protein
MTQPEREVSEDELREEWEDIQRQAAIDDEINAAVCKTKDYCTRQFVGLWHTIASDQQRAAKCRGRCICSEIKDGPFKLDVQGLEDE